jgi:tetratricopeptide (TPR) repeat protein
MWQNPRADNHATIGYATLNGARIKVLFDTGASYSFLSFAAARRARIDPNGPGTETGPDTSGIGRGTVKTRIAPVETFQIGGETIKHTRLRLGDEDIPDADMLIGVDFFLSHRVYVANSQGKIYFTYNGGPVFALEPQTAAAPGDAPLAPKTMAPDEPKSAVDYGRRGAGELVRLEYGLAINDLSRAHDLAPNEPLYTYQRAEAYYAAKEPEKALADLDATLALSPKDVDALILRARLRSDADEAKKAVEDARAVTELLPKQADQRFALARLYEKADDFENAWVEYETWMRAHPDDAKRMAAFAGLCWVGALGGEHLGQAKRACDEVHRLVSDDSMAQTGRSLIEFRLRDYFAAFNDGRDAAKRAPKDAWALYAKGLGEMRLGKPYPDRTEQGRIDLAAAKAIDPKVVTRAIRLGLTP